MTLSNELGLVLKSWNIHDFYVGDSSSIAGSPERASKRFLISAECNNTQKYILEELFPKKVEQRMLIAKTLAEYDNPVISKYLENMKGEYITSQTDKSFQLSKFIHGIELPRPEYQNDAWRGQALAEFLIWLKKNSNKYESEFDTCNIVDYVQKIAADIKIVRPDIYPKIVSVLEKLNEFFDIYPKLRIGFCHGDYHPMNVIWGDKRINGIIDWEFMGNKPELYDAANMIGCVGFEHPDGLQKELVLTFISWLKGSGLYDELSFRYLRELILANRFGWISEWIRKKDEEMVQLELVYMDILIKKPKIQ